MAVQLQKRSTQSGKHILSFKSGQAVASHLFQDCVLPSFKRAMFNVCKQLENEKDELFQQQIASGTAAKKARKTSKEEEEEEEKKKRRRN